MYTIERKSRHCHGYSDVIVKIVYGTRISKSEVRKYVFIRFVNDRLIVANIDG